MTRTSRRNLLKVAVAGGASAALGLAIKPEASRGGTAVAAEQGHSHKPVSGPLANATINFGSWETNPLFDRFTVPTPPPPATRNHHAVVPNEVRIQAGGAVTFVIAGFHLVLIYGDGTQPGNINPNAVVTGSVPPLINDPNTLIYRGLDPRTVSQDRLEAVTFPNPGTYLVICGVRPHFVNDDMFGFVTVLP